MSRRVTDGPPWRILHVIARLNVGGPAVVIEALLDGMDRDRFDLRVLTGSVESDEADYLELRRPDLEVVRLPALRRSLGPIGDWRAMSGIVREMRSFRPHIVHTHTAKAGVLGRLAARATGVPRSVHTFHGHLLYGYHAGPVRAAVRFAENRMAAGTDRLVAVGERVRDELLDAGIGRADQFVSIPPTFTMGDSPSRQRARAMLGVRPEAFVVGFVGRLTEVKRPDRLVEVARRVLREAPSTVFLVSGEGPLYDPTRSAAADLGSSVRFLGWRSDPETVWAASDVALLTSDNEGMPVSLIEAAAAGIPAVTTAVGSAGEVVVDGGTGFVRGHEVASLAEAVLQLAASEPLRLKMGAAASARARDEYSPGRLVDRTQRLYSSLVEAGRPASSP